MPIIENTSEHEIHLIGFAGEEKSRVTVRVPRGNGEQGASKVNGSVEVPDDVFKLVDAFDGNKQFFESGELLVSKAKPAKVHAEDPAHGHAHKK